MSIYNISVNDIDGNTLSLETYNDKVIVIVNTASEWGFNSQLGELEEIYQEYKDKGFVVLAFPSDQFNQEPLSNQEIKTVYPEKFNVHYPIFQKINVNGKDQHPLYSYLKEENKGFLVKAIKWNYTKFLIDRNGKVINRYASKTSPKDIIKDIEELL